VASLVFVSALGRWLGGGLALLATLLAGICRQPSDRFHLFKTSHNVVGASTATFGALGVLGGLQFVRRFHVRSVGRVRRAMLGVAAALGLFAMLGMGERSDVVAHAGGLGFGILFGVLLGQFVERPVRAPAQALALLATVATLTGAWMLAFRHP
jgi:rhomboid protease GluP